MRHRAAVLVVTLALSFLSAPLAADAQQLAEKIFRIDFLATNPPTTPEVSRIYEAFLHGLRELGWVEGKNIAIEWRFAEGRPERLPGLATELIRLKVDIIVASAVPAALAAKNATKTIPIVFPVAGDPVGTGLVASLARPGGNITGLTSLAEELSGKRLELLKEALPGVSRVAVLWNAANPAKALEWRETQGAARAMGVQLQSVEVRGPDDFETAFAAMTRKRPAALFVVGDTLTFGHRKQIVDFAAKSRLPAMYEWREAVEVGGLMSYGASLPGMFRRAATYVDKILKGAKPADLPVEQPTRFELVINLKTARALGLTIPQSILVRADEVIK